MLSRSRLIARLSLPNRLGVRAAICCMVLLAVPPSCRANIFNVRSYGAHGDGTTDDQPAIQAAINAAIQAGPGNQVYIPSGSYMLGTDAAGVGAQINIFQAQSLLIQGDKNTVLLNPSTKRDFFYLWADRGLTVNSLTLQRTERMFSQMQVDSIDSKANSVSVTLESGYDQLDADTISDTALLLVFSDPASGTWGDHLSDCGFFSPGDKSVCWPPTVVSRSRISANRWVLKLNTQPQQNYVGARAVLWVIHGGGSAFVATASQDVTVKNTSYYAAGADSGFYLAGNTGAFTVDNFIMDVTPGTDDLVAAQGGSYAMNNHTALTINASKIVRVWDDAVNIGANFARIYDQASPRVIDVDGSRGDFVAGDTIALWDWTYHGEHERTRASATQVSCNSSSSGRVCRLWLDRDVTVVQVGHLTPGIAADKDGIDRVIDIESAGSLTVRNSTFQSFHARGVVFRPSNTIISNNSFLNTVNSAIQTGSDFLAEEGPAASNVTISQNLFQNISSSNVVVGSRAGDGNPSTVERDMSNISISNNRFLGFGRFTQGTVGNPNAPLFLRNVASSSVTSNQYSASHPTARMAGSGIDSAYSATPVAARNVALGESAN
jgi:hypothetical protein